MKDQIKFLAVMAIITVVGSLTLTYAQSLSVATATTTNTSTDFPPPPPPDGFRHGPGPGAKPDFVERLNLTGEQREQIGLIMISRRDASRENEKKIRAVDEQLRLLVEGGSFTAEAAAPLLRAKADAMTAVELKQLAGDAEIYKLLTSEQKTQLSQLRAQRPPMPPGGGFERPAKN